MPSSPHVDASVLAQSLVLRGGLPATIGWHVPSDVASAQVTHVPLQALSQHTPSTQKPLLHWASQEQARPLSLLREPSSMHAFGASAASDLPPSLIDMSMPPSLAGFDGDLLQAPTAASAAASTMIRQEPWSRPHPRRFRPAKPRIIDALPYSRVKFKIIRSA